MSTFRGSPAGIAAVGLLAATVGWTVWRTGTTDATLRNTVELGTNHLATATVDIALGPTVEPLRVVDMAPGDTAVLALELRNDGDLPVLASLTVVGDGSPLGAALELRAWTAPACPRAASDGPTTARPATAVRSAASGAATLLGDPTPGRQAGDLALAPGARTTLCYEVSLPLAAADAVAASEAAQVLVVDAEQDLADASVVAG